MSIFGFKKNQLDVIEKEMFNMNNSILSIDTTNTNLHKSINILTLRVTNNENMIIINRNKTDRKIISIYATIDNTLETGQLFNFGDGGNYFLLTNPGEILYINSDSISVNILINDIIYPPGLNLQNGTTHYYHEFDNPIKFKAGDVLSFQNMGYSPKALNTMVSVIIELFI